MTARQIAAEMLRIGAVLVRPDDPFKWTSGFHSPVYVDCRKIVSYPTLRDHACFIAFVNTWNATGGGFSVIAGGETAGIPFAAWIAQDRHLPMIYVRKTPKGFGTNARIEGELRPGQSVLLVEDLASEGTSKKSFVGAIREAGGVCNHATVIFSYDFPETKVSLADHGIQLHAATTLRHIYDAAKADDLLPEASLAVLGTFMDNPVEFSRRFAVIH